MEQDFEKIAKESLKFLKEIVERGWAAYPVSLLPYPKEQIKEALENYLADIFTVSANIVGVPAVSLPSGFAEIDGKM